MSRLWPLRWAAGVYIWFLRGTPVLLQLVFLFDGLPSLGITLPAIPTAILGFTLNEAAYLAELLRGGLISVDAGQIRAAESLGMSPWTLRRWVVFPQAFRVILPGLGNELISLLKATSLASIISVLELTQRAEIVASQTFQYLPVFSAAALIYLFMTSGIALTQLALERYFHIDRVRGAGTAWRPEWDRWLGFGRRITPTTAEPSIHSTGPTPTDRRPEDLLASSEARKLVVMPGVEALTSSTPPKGEVLLKINDVCKAYGSTTVLAGVTTSLRAGEVVAVMGASGAGKSTLLRLINHLEVLDSGSILVAGKPVGYDETGAPIRSKRQLSKARASARIGMVFQHFDLFANMPVLANLTVALERVQGVSRDAARERGRALLAQVGLSRHERSMPHKLSGGQQQRVAIARALAIEPTLMLFDEPTSALDPELVGEVLETIRHLASQGMTMLVVTHEVSFARGVADRIVFMSDGRILLDGPPDEVLAAVPTRLGTQVSSDLQPEGTF